MPKLPGSLLSREPLDRRRTGNQTGGLEAVITLQAGWGFIEYKKKYPILQERPIAEREHPLGSEEKGSAEE